MKKDEILKILNEFSTAIISTEGPKIGIKGKDFDSIVERLSNEWVSVEERLPEVLGFYLVCVDKDVASKHRGQVEIGDLYQTVYNGKICYKFQDYVTHWMPLPELPKTS